MYCTMNLSLTFSMKTLVRRTLVIKYPLSKLSNEEREVVSRLLPRLDALGNLYARGYKIGSPDVPRRFVSALQYFQEELAFSMPPKRWLARVHPLLNCQVRLNNEKDRSEGVFVDLSKGVVKIRGLIHRRAIKIPLSDSTVKYIRQRVEEGAKAKLARVWTNDGYLYVAVTFERETEVRQDVDAILAVDVNSWRNGISWSLIKDGRVVSKGVERPHLRYVKALYNDVVKLERKLGKLERLGLKEGEEYARLWEQARTKRSKLYRYLMDFADRLAHRLAKKAVKHNAKVMIDDVVEESRRELLEEGLSNGLAKLYFAYVRRFVKLLANQAKWYGLPVVFKRLPSTICPVCGAKLEQGENRLMVCPNCGYSANRDEVPIYWASKLSVKLSGSIEVNLKM